MAPLEGWATLKEHSSKNCLYVKAKSVYFVSCMENKIAS